jgi:hypothetical protein
MTDYCHLISSRIVNLNKKNNLLALQNRS